MGCIRATFGFLASFPSQNRLPVTTLGTRGETARKTTLFMLIDTDEFVIVGLTQDGSRFRPEDCAWRLCHVLCPYAGHGTDSPYVKPILLSDGTPGVVVDARLNEVEPRAYRFVMRFAKDNDLVVRPGRAFDRS